ncbi:hypothetical protein ACE1OC_34765 [Streptomyces sp. DSM 116496]|uniref:hypothetical protein n=1 Tax=Streptomyces stoeckheimensis TaxID=3344656 RepID=UPI0038B3C63A
MSSTVKDMLATYPADLGNIDQAKLTGCIEAVATLAFFGLREVAASMETAPGGGHSH